MAVIHTPETSGITAVFTEEDGGEKRVRAVLGWDKLGRPLVQCGDRLYPAADAPYAVSPKFQFLEPAPQPDPSEHLDWLFDKIWDSIEYEIDRIGKAVRNDIKAHLDERHGVQHVAPPTLFDTFIPEVVEAADISNHVDQSELWGAWLAYVFAERQENTPGVAYGNNERFARRVAASIPDAQFRLGTRNVYGVKLAPLGEKWSHALDSLTTPFGRFLRDAVVRAEDGNGVKPDDVLAAWSSYAASAHPAEHAFTIEQVIETVTTALPYVTHRDGVFHGINWRSTQA